jgi:hypothetical protein
MLQKCRIVRSPLAQIQSSAATCCPKPLHTTPPIRQFAVNSEWGTKTVFPIIAVKKEILINNGMLMLFLELLFNCFVNNINNISSW